MFYSYLRTIFTITAFFLAVSGRAQGVDTARVDTLIHYLTLQKSDSATVDAYLDLSDEYMKVFDYSISLTYADLANELARKIGYKEGELLASMGIAHIYLAYHLDYRRAIKYYDHSLKLAEELNSELNKIAIYKGYALVYAAVNNFDLAISFNDRAIEIAETMNDDRLISDLHAYGGSIYEEMGDTAKALEMYEVVVSIEEENNYINTSFPALAAIAHYYFLKGDNSKSLRMYRSAIKKFERMQDYRWTAYGHAEIARVYLSENKLDKAERHALKGLEISQIYDLNKEIADNYLVLSQVYKAMGDQVNQQKYEELYHSIVDSVMVDINPRISEIANTSDKANTGSGTSTQLLSGAVILGLTVLLVFLSGFSRKKV